MLFDIDDGAAEGETRGLWEGVFTRLKIFFSRLFVDLIYRFLGCCFVDVGTRF